MRYQWSYVFLALSHRYVVLIQLMYTTGYKPKSKVVHFRALQVHVYPISLYGVTLLTRKHRVDEIFISGCPDNC